MVQFTAQAHAQMHARMHARMHAHPPACAYISTHISYKGLVIDARLRRGRGRGALASIFIIGASPCTNLLRMRAAEDVQKHHEASGGM